MPPTKSDTLPLHTELDIVAARQFIRKLSQEAKFSLVEQTKMVTAASELARNTVVHGRGGEMHWEVLNDHSRVGLRLTFSDDGPGIDNVNQAMTDGFTTGVGLGMGLGGAKRLVNDFDLDTAPGRGTRVTITRWK